MASSNSLTPLQRELLHAFFERTQSFFLTGGGALIEFYLHHRDTKDLDLFVRRADWPKAADALNACGFETELTFPHWLGKAFGGRSREFFVDLIFSGGNGVAEVDDEWFAHALRGEALGFPVRMMPVEEMIWSKAFVMERERFDGADVAHLIRARQDELNWPRLLQRFGEHWRVFLAHLILFTYIYPTDRAPQQAIDELLNRLNTEPSADPELRICRGTLLSRAQYLVDVEKWNYADARLVPLGTMTPEEMAVWTEAIEK